MEYISTSHVCPYCNYLIGPPTADEMHCPKCDSLLVSFGRGYKKKGEFTLIPDTLSPIKTDTEGKYKNIPFKITGRYYYRDHNSYCNAWYMEAGINSSWLYEGYGMYMVLKKTDVSINRKAISNIKAGQNLKLHDGTYSILSIDKFSTILNEGETPKRNTSTPLYNVALGISEHRAMAEIADDEKIILFKGDTVPFKNLNLTNTRTIDGW